MPAQPAIPQPPPDVPRDMGAALVMMRAALVAVSRHLRERGIERRDRPRPQETPHGARPRPSA